MNAPETTTPERLRVSYDTHPERYHHWKLAVDGPLATLTLDVAEDKGLAPGYKLKLNSYDLGVDIELNDAMNRIRFEHPGVRCVVITSGKARMFCSGANIYMLGTSSHGWKVNFCKFTNETRNGLEDSSRHSGLKTLAALNGTTAGGGYEMALACDEILMVDDRSSTVSLPEVPLLGVLPGTGGLTRVVDKRKVRRDLADIFCTTAEGVRADRAKEWGLIDALASPKTFEARTKKRALALAKRSTRTGEGAGVALTPIECTIDDTGYHYRTVDVIVDRAGRTAKLTVKGPSAPLPQTPEAMLAEGARWWPLAMARDLDDAILMLRTNEPELGLWLLHTQGTVQSVLESDRLLEAHAAHWFVRETTGLLRRTFSRLDVSSRSLFAVIERDSCFAGTLLELALAADRSFMLALPDAPQEAPRIALSAMNFGTLPMASEVTRLQARFCEKNAPVNALKKFVGTELDPAQALGHGLVTLAPDDLDWDDEVRIATEERVSLSPDALTGMEASLRFSGRETMATRIFGRLTAWQNWIFNRPNAVGEQGALKLYGTGAKPNFNWERI